MLLIIGVIIGLVLGLTGAGGSIFAVPLLLLGGLSMTSAVGISLGAVAASSLYGSLRNGLSQKILWLPGAILAIAGALATPLGNWLGQQFSEFWLLLGFTVLAGVISLRMWLSANRDPESARVVRAGVVSDEVAPGLLCNLSRTGQFELRPRCVSGLLVGGLLTGILAGLFGVGGGFLIVPLLLALSPITMSQAVSTSLVIIAVISSAGFVSHTVLSHVAIDWHVLAWVAGGGVIGMMIGQALSSRIANAQLQKLFAAALIILSLATLIVT